MKECGVDGNLHTPSEDEVKIWAPPSDHESVSQKRPCATYTENVTCLRRENDHSIEILILLPGRSTFNREDRYSLVCDPARRSLTAIVLLVHAPSVCIFSSLKRQRLLPRQAESLSPLYPVKKTEEESKRASKVKPPQTKMAEPRRYIRAAVDEGTRSLMSPSCRAVELRNALR